MRDWAVGLEDLDCGLRVSVQVPWVEWGKDRGGQKNNKGRAVEMAQTSIHEVVGDLLKTMISRIKTMKPTTPPPAPYCHVLPWWPSVMTGAAVTRENMRNWSSMARVF